MGKTVKERVKEYRERQKKKGLPDSTRAHKTQHSRDYEKKAQFQRQFGTDPENVPCKIEKP